MDSALVRPTTPLILVVFALCAFANGMAAGAAAPHNEKTTDLTGLWTLNKGLSDDPAKVMEAMQAERHGGSSGGGRMPPGGFGGHGPGMHGRGSGMSGGRGGMDPEQMRAQMNRTIAPPGRLTITQTESSITFTDSDGRSQTLTTNNKKEKRPLDNREVEVRTKWDEGRLVKEMSLGDGIKLTETYSLVSAPRQLHVMVKLESSHLPRPVNLRRVYDAESLR